MKVLYIINSSALAGATISLINMIKGLAKLNIEPVIVLPPHPTAFFVDFLETNNIKHYFAPLDDIIWPSIKNWKSAIKFSYNLYKTIQNNNRCIKILTEICAIEHPDIIHSNTGTLHSGFTVSKKHNIPHIWHLREYQDLDFDWHIFPSKRIFQKRLNESHVITITNDIKNYFALSDDVALTIYNGILTRSSATFTWPKKSYFITANNLFPAKSMETTILAFSKFIENHPDFKLVICGSGDSKYIKYLKEYSQKLNCSKNIDWLGPIRNVTEIMKDATALIVSSKNEGFGRMTAEACFMGTIPIGRNTGGTKEILDKVGGLRFDTVHDLVHRMNEVVNMSSNQYQSMIESIQRKAVDAYSIESNVEQVYNYYIKILNK